MDNLISLKLKNHPGCKCKILLDNIDNPTEVHFISYITEVITAVYVDGFGWCIKCSGTYSQTTRRQISWFLREYFPLISYYDIKEIAGKPTHIVYEDGIGKVS